MSPLLRTFFMALITIAMTLGLANCAIPQQQSGLVNSVAGGYASYVAPQVRSSRFVVQGAGRSVYEGSMYDPRTHPAIAQQYAAVRPLVVAGGGGDTLPPTAQQAQAGSPRVAASDAQLSQVAQTVGEQGARLRAMNHALTSVQHAVGQIGSDVRALREQRREHHSARTRSAPVSNPPAAPGPEVEQMTLEDGRTITVTPEP
ncbi:hypothetical protein KBB27_00065 [Patescibacteria group bacterium]|nr:hypothetical protein [Patescibacteria group bacterium]